mmetsp:Transcript_20624/g.55083  ORF Transcript_20624/g.55083 Transcript_20624/m.55083 type:complete len:178 (+) Transcript_20624:1538-2071(+)
MSLSTSCDSSAHSSALKLKPISVLWPLITVARLPEVFADNCPAPSTPAEVLLKMLEVLLNLGAPGREDLPAPALDTAGKEPRVVGEVGEALDRGELGEDEAGESSEARRCGVTGVSGDDDDDGDADPAAVDGVPGNVGNSGVRPLMPELPPWPLDSLPRLRLLALTAIGREPEWLWP